MEVISKDELNNIVGGKALWYIIGGIGAFLVGIFNGVMSNKDVCVKGGKK